MLLAIDSGNTNTTFAVIDGGGSVRASWRTSTNARRTADEYAVWLLQLMALHGLAASEIDAAIIANVVPDLAFNLDKLCRQYFHHDPLWVGDPGVTLGISVRVDRPEEVGADRLVNAVAAFDAFGGPLLIIDFGTATTFDVVAADGAYCGGVIAPGINLSLEALYLAAAKLPGVRIRRTPRVIGRNTVDAMESGVFWGYVGMIEGLVRRMRAELAAEAPPGTLEARVVATGGLASLFAKSTPEISAYDPDLTMRGLYLIWRNTLARRAAAASPG